MPPDHWHNLGMPEHKITHLLLDFFGTIVDYSPSRTEQDYSHSYGLVLQSAAAPAYSEFLALCDEVFSAFDDRSATDLREFSMHDAAAVILDRVLGRPAATTEIDAFVDAYLHDWNAAVLYPAGMAELLHDLARRYRLALVSNTHSRTLVPDHLTAMGVADLFDTVVLSIDVGYRKPHPAIYRAALDEFGIDAASALFIGDTYEADYLGPHRQGIAARLIDPKGSAPIADDDRLTSLFNLRSLHR